MGCLGKERVRVVTLEWLRKRSFHDPQSAEFVRLFGSQMELSRENLVRLARTDFDLAGFAELLLDSDDWKELAGSLVKESLAHAQTVNQADLAYQLTFLPAWSFYEDETIRARERLWAETSPAVDSAVSNDSENPAWKTYEREIATAWWSFVETLTPAERKYQAVAGAAWTEFHTALAHRLADLLILA